MSARYNLRRRVGTPPVTETITGEHVAAADRITDSRTGSSPQSSPVAPESPRLGAERRANLTYSQVASSRPPTPASNAGSATVLAVAKNIFIPSHSDIHPVAEATKSTKYPVSVEEVTDEDEGGPWLPVRHRRRRAHSTPGAIGYQQNLCKVRDSVQLSTRQHEAVQQAEKMLTPAEQDRYARRMRYAQDARRRVDTESTDSRGEGPSDPMRKGKAVYARNWGAVGIPDDELDPDAQRRELDMYNKKYNEFNSDEPQNESGHEANTSVAVQPQPLSTEDVRPQPGGNAELRAVLEQLNSLRNDITLLKQGTQSTSPETAPKKSKPTKRKKSRSSGKKPTNMKDDIPTKSGTSKVLARGAGRTRHSSLRPVAQLEPGSYLGRAFEDLIGGGDPGDSSGSSSSSSEASNSSSAGRSTIHYVGSSSSDNVSRTSSDNSSTGVHSRSKSKKKKLVLKPEKPDPYDGRPDAQVFHKFMRQMTEYLSAFDIEPEMLASHVSNFLKGDAYNFWVTTVSKAPRKWTLRRLFVEMFNYCFPVNYRLQMQEKLRRSFFFFFF